MTPYTMESILWHMLKALEEISRDSKNHLLIQRVNYIRSLLDENREE